MTPPGPERRLFPRKKLRTRVVLEDETGEGFVFFYSTDISIGGLFFESDVPLKIGTRAFLSFALEEGDRPIRSIGQIVRVERESGAGVIILGVGVQFLDLAEENRRQIEAYVNS